MRSLRLILVILAASLPARALAGPAEEARAGVLFDQAEAAYQEGRFKDAIALLLEAQRLAPDAVLHYNLARAYEGLGDLENALASYRAYVEADPKSKDRGAIEARIKTLDALKASQNEKQAPPPKIEPRSEPRREPRSPSPVPWVIAGVGALSLGAGGVLGGLSLSKSSEAEDPGTSGADAALLESSASDLALGANIAFGVGGAVLAAGVIWGIVDVATLGEEDAASASAELRFQLTPSGVRVAGTF